jgi:hypothetical protein
MRLGRKLVTKRKALWKHNAIRTNRANRPPPDSKAARSKIARDRNGNANSASATKAVDSKVAANKAAVGRADDKTECLALTGGGSSLPPLVMPGYLEKDLGSVSALLS